MKLVIAGSAGRMGHALIEAAAADAALSVAATFDVGDDAPRAIAAGEVLIDFTRPDATLEHLKHAKAMVIGTTGFSDAQKKAVEEAARRIPIVMAANFAVGVNAVYRLAET